MSCFDYREFCIFDTNRIKIIGLIEFGVVPDPNFLYPPVKVYDNLEKVGTDVWGINLFCGFNRGILIEHWEVLNK